MYKSQKCLSLFEIKHTSKNVTYCIRIFIKIKESGKQKFFTQQYLLYIASDIFTYKLKLYNKYDLAQ